MSTQIFLLLVALSLTQATPQDQEPGYSLQQPDVPLRPRPTVPPPTVPPPPPPQLYSNPEVVPLADTPEQVVRKAPSSSPMVGMPYELSWSVDDAESGNSYSHDQQSDGTTMSGQYQVLLPDGRLQVVTFYDRGNGYVAEVTYQ